MNFYTFALDMIQGIIFDLDGTLIDSEPLWEEAQLSVFSEMGVTFEHDDYIAAKGLPTHDAVKLWYDKIENPGKEPALIVQEINQRVINIIKDKGKLKAGVPDLLEYWKSKRLPMGIASASSMAHIKTVVDKYNLNDYFGLIYSGDFERFGKPHPGIYISACKKLKIDPLKSVAIEDSFNGILAAKSARLKVVALLDEGQYGDTTYDFVDIKVETLEGFGDREFEQLQQLM